MWEIKQKADSPESLDLYIYGDVEGDSYDFWTDQIITSETSAKHFKETLEEHKDVSQINIFINSYGGSVFEGNAIYNQLKRHSAHKTVYIDGFACSIASVIAMAGDEIVMPKNALMMIHNAWMWACGNAAELRKAAEDLEIINKAGRSAYLEKAGEKLTEEQLVKMMDEETWLTADQCIEYGLADRLEEKEAELSEKVLQSANVNVQQRLDIQKSLVAQLRELVSPKAEEPVEEIAEETSEEIIEQVESVEEPAEEIKVVEQEETPVIVKNLIEKIKENKK